MDITGVGSSSYLYGYGISDSDTKNVTGKENGIGSVDENGKQKECQTCKNRKYVDGSDEANVSFKSAAHVPRRLHHRQSVHMRGSMYPMPTARHPRKMAG